VILSGAEESESKNEIERNLTKCKARKIIIIPTLRRAETQSLFQKFFLIRNRKKKKKKTRMEDL